MKDSDLSKSWSSEGPLAYYTSKRNRAEDLYPSEMRFFEKALRKGNRILDVGCAAGGFSRIVKEYKPRAEYVGVDISTAMIETARKMFPGERFYTCDGERLEFPDGSFDVGISFGVLHMTERWRSLLKEMWRVCTGAVLFDLRVVPGEGICDHEKSYQNLEFDGRWDGVSRAPYVVVGVSEVEEFLCSLKPRMSGLKGYGYFHGVSENTVSPFKKVCMSVFMLEKLSIEPGLTWDLPMPVPEDLQRSFVMF